jgi:predicted Zn-dependent peptidase
MPHELPLVASDDPRSELSFEQDHGALIRRSVLPGGVRVLTEHIPGMRSATIGAWVGVGSRDETPTHGGSTHFLEHLLFKGTATRTALDIAESFDRVGGEHNAMTGKEYTAYYARILDADVRMAIEITLDMVTSSRIDEADFELERTVILEEIAMNDDDPSDVVSERFAEAILGGHPLGRPIGGTPEIIRAVPRDAVWAHYREHYVPAGLVLAAAGGVDHDEVCALVTTSLRSGGWDLSSPSVPLPRRNTSASVEAKLTPNLHIERDDEQVNVIIGTRGYKASDPRRSAVAVYNAILGGGMSSRLFQEVRENRGLAYNVYSFPAPSAETGLFGMYAGCAPERADQVMELMVAEFERMAAGVTDAELERAKGQIVGSTVLRLEDSYSRMSRLARSELVFGDLWSIGEALDEVRAVTADDVAGVAAELASRERAVVRVGPRPGA